MRVQLFNFILKPHFVCPFTNRNIYVNQYEQTLVKVILTAGEVYTEKITEGTESRSLI